MIHSPRNDFSKLNSPRLENANLNSQGFSTNLASPRLFTPRIQTAVTT
jgi:hypothetical protein